MRGGHWARVLRDDPRCQVTGFVDLQVEVARGRAVEFGYDNIPCFADLETALDTVTSDIVLLVTPPEFHYAQALSAFARGCHVLCEKPLAENLSEAIEIVRAAEQHRVLLGVGMNHRYISGAQELRRRIRSREFGAPSYGNYCALRNRDGRRPGLNKYPLTMAQPLLLEESIHHLDLLRYCYGVEATAVSAETWRPSWSSYADDCCASALLTFEGNLHVTYLATWTTGWNRRQFQWRTDLPGGVFIQDDFFGGLSLVHLDPDMAMQGAIYRREQDTEPIERIPFAAQEAFIDDTRGLLDEFIGAIRGERTLDASGKDHLRSLALVLACIKAAHTGKRIDVKAFSVQQGIPDAWL